MAYTRDGQQTYFDAPEHGLAGRRPGTDLPTRLLGLDPLLEPERCRGARVLDLGCAEGLIALELARRGAACVHGFDLQEVSIAHARRLFAEVECPHVFRQADLAGGTFERAHADVLLPRYDVILFLGVYHHVVRQGGAVRADRLLAGLAERCAGVLAIRTKAAIPEALLEARGLRRAWSHDGDETRATGTLTVWEPAPESAP